MMTNTLDTLQNSVAESLRVAMRCAGIALLALPLALHAPAATAAQAKKTAAKVAHAKHAVKKGKIVAAKAGKIAKVAKAGKTTRGAAAKLAHGKKPGTAKHARANQKRTLTAQRKAATVTKVVAAPAPRPLPLADVRPAIARPERTAALSGASLAADREQVLSQPDFKVATAACQRDGRIYLLAGCDSADLPEVKTASLTPVDAR